MALETPQMDDYRRYVEKMADLNDGGEIILNRSPEHATVIASVLFDRAIDHVEILTGNLRDDIFGTEEVTAAAINFLKKSASSKIEVIADTPNTITECAFIKAVPNNLRCRISLATTEEKKPFRFMVADARSYRFQGDAETPEAIVQFGSKETGKKLHDIFVQANARAKHIAL
jgi:hypothetical protein